MVRTTSDPLTDVSIVEPWRDTAEVLRIATPVVFGLILVEIVDFNIIVLPTTSFRLN